MKVITEKISLLTKTIENLTTTLNKKMPPLDHSVQPVRNPEDDSILSSNDGDAIPQVDGTSDPSSRPEYCPFRCDTCNEVFADPDAFIIHDSYPYRCDTCHSFFPIKIAWDLHRCLPRQK